MYALMHVWGGSLNQFWRLREVDSPMPIKYTESTHPKSSLSIYGNVIREMSPSCWFTLIRLGLRRLDNLTLTGPIQTSTHLLGSTPGSTGTYFICVY